MKIKLKTRCFLLKSKPYSETSLLLTVFAENPGLITILAKGLRKDKDRKDIVLNTLNEYEVIITEPVTPGLYLLNEICLMSEYPADLPLETWFCTQGGAELLTKLLIPQDETHQFYLALQQYLAYQKNVVSNPIAIFWRFTLHIIRLLGVPIILDECADCHSQSQPITAFRPDSGQLLCTDCQLKYGTVHPLSPESTNLLKLLPVIGNYLNDLSISNDSILQLNHFFLHYLNCQFHQTLHLKSLDFYRP